jgi:hypothetical protein
MEGLASKGWPIRGHLSWVAQAQATQGFRGAFSFSKLTERSKWTAKLTAQTKVPLRWKDWQKGWSLIAALGEALMSAPEVELGREWAAQSREEWVAALVTALVAVSAWMVASVVKFRQ